MATPVLDKVNTSSTTTPGTTLNFNLNSVTSDPNNYVVVVVDCITTSAPPTAVVSTLTIGGVNASQIIGCNNGGSSELGLELWGLGNVGGGTIAIAITMSKSCDRLSGAARSFLNVNQATPTGTPATDTSNTNPFGATFTSAVGELGVDAGLNWVASATIAPNTGGQTSDYNFTDSGSFDHAGSEMAGAASLHPTWQITGTLGYTLAAGVSLKPSAAGGLLGDSLMIFSRWF